MSDTPVPKTPQELADTPVIVLSDAAFDRLTEILENDKTAEPSPALKALMNRPTRWVEAKDTKKKPKLRVAIELVGGDKELVAEHVVKVPVADGSPFMYLNYSMARTGWTLVYTDGVIDDIQKLERIEIIRREEPLYRALRFVGLDLELELEVVTGLRLPTQGIFNLDQLPSGKWRLCYDTGTFPDLTQIESLNFTVLS